MKHLAPKQLHELAFSLGQQPERWQHLVHHRPDRRHFEQLRLDEEVGVWVLSWMNGHDTGFHDHDISSGAFVVVQGELIEERLRFGAPASSLTLTAGEGTHFRPSDIHRVLHAGNEPSVSIHAYSPPLVRMGSYVLEEGGALLRHPIGPVEELRPILASVA